MAHVVSSGTNWLRRRDAPEGKAGRGAAECRKRPCDMSSWATCTISAPPAMHNFFLFNDLPSLMTARLRLRLPVLSHDLPFHLQPVSFRMCCSVHLNDRAFFVQCTLFTQHSNSRSLYSAAQCCSFMFCYILQNWHLRVSQIKAKSSTWSFL